MTKTPYEFMQTIDPLNLRAQRKAHKEQVKLKPSQKEVLYGMLLSDAYITIPPKCVHASVQFSQGEGQWELIDHLFKVFRNWTWYPHPKLNFHRKYWTIGNTDLSKTDPSLWTRSYRFRTFSHPIFTQIYNEFYPKLGERKRIPEDITTWLTPRVLAYQIMGDGSFQRKQVFLHTEGFCREDNYRYAQAINQAFDLQSYPRRSKNEEKVYWKIVFPTRDLSKLQDLLQPYILPSFGYKLGLSPKGGLYGDLNAGWIT
uniref:LAGLIDADG homing endonuclease n=1 Tax=Medakamo hakoo TaxID=3113649 RepID=A0A8D5PXZ7_9CHLO|nr:LAGLIDADG homing endonuclease [Medakamo hakoo]